MTGPVKWGGHGSWAFIFLLDFQFNLIFCSPPSLLVLLLCTGAAEMQTSRSLYSPENTLSHTETVFTLWKRVENKNTVLHRLPNTFPKRLQLEASSTVNSSNALRWETEGDKCWKRKTKRIREKGESFVKPHPFQMGNNLHLYGVGGRVAC